MCHSSRRARRASRLTHRSHVIDPTYQPRTAVGFTSQCHCLACQGRTSDTLPTRSARSDYKVLRRELKSLRKDFQYLDGRERGQVLDRLAQTLDQTHIHNHRRQGQDEEASHSAPSLRAVSGSPLASRLAHSPSATTSPDRSTSGRKVSLLHYLKDEVKSLRSEFKSLDTRAQWQLLDHTVRSRGLIRGGVELVRLLRGKRAGCGDGEEPKTFEDSGTALVVAAPAHVETSPVSAETLEQVSKTRSGRSMPPPPYSP